ncbi:PP2C family serine/threonine-protein phosphatase [Aliikangiella sp. G2MR2-5]|uniref:PP2C family protein-serine/threonine phosphatase n=1 Tax=Aliikangiella sp. G2MR2-5 TaxID=2788943 RepID=UPI0018AA8EBE|nr:PP2C family serine/threonine-protein phosphatase [Aliikangiella sp. G2MR2-5]
MEDNTHICCQSVQITDVGCVRELNEDSLYSGDGLWLVADGMGGHACGEVASQLAAETISSEFLQAGDLSQAIQKAHKQIIKAGEEGQGQSGMGTTVVALAANAKSYQIAWVGDSRAYLWDHKKKSLSQLTEDHSLIVRLINSGLISAEEAKSHPQRHMITQCLGSVEIGDVKVDTLEAQWLPGQSILLCSDGLSDDVSEAEISKVLGNSDSVEQKMVQLVELAKAAGGKDNISAILVESPIQFEPGLWEKIKALFSKYK